MQIKTTWQGFREGVSFALPLQLGIFPWGLTFGLVASQLALTAPQSIGMSAVVFSGTAQMVILEFWRMPLAWIPLSLAVFSINARYLLQGATLAPWLKQVRPIHRAALLWPMVDISWATSLERFKRNQAQSEPADFGFMHGMQIVCFSSWVLSTSAGALLPLQGLDMKKWGLDIAISAVLIALFAGNFRWRSPLGKRLPWRHWQWSWPLALLFAWLSREALGGHWYVIVGGGVAAALAAISATSGAEPKEEGSAS